MLNTTRSLACSRSLLTIQGFPNVTAIAGLKNLEKPLDFSDITLPEKPKLSTVEKVPTLPGGIRALTCSKRLVDIRGAELVHNKLLYGQFGLVAIVGGHFRHAHFEVIRLTVNRRIDTKTTFAVWRLDPPWKPITKKSQGKRMGGGKADIHHYSTPVKAGRVLFELGGKIQYEEVLPILQSLARKMPVKSIPVSQAILDEMAAEEKRQTEENLNPYTFKYILENNLAESHKWASPYDFEFLGKYR